MHISLMDVLTPVQDFLIHSFNAHPFLSSFILLIVEEAGIPSPIPGEIYIAEIGYLISIHAISYVNAVLLLSFSIFIGASILYYLSYHWGRQIVLYFGKYIQLNEKKLNFIERKFRQYGMPVIIIGRLIPGFRIPITIFSGLSGLTYPSFILSVIISNIIWLPIFLEIGRRFGPKTLQAFHNHFPSIVFLIIPITLTCITIGISRFIPESSAHSPKKKK